jgi:hypothetical protein
MTSVLQDWITNLPMKEQATLLSALRGCDEAPKQYQEVRYLDANGMGELETKVIDSPERRVVAWLRSVCLNAANPGEEKYPGGYMYGNAKHVTHLFFPDQFGHYPQHWYAHLMHGLEVIGYRHPNAMTRGVGFYLYEKMADNCHLNIETREEYIARLRAER